jgi:hypothetical protein
MESTQSLSAGTRAWLAATLILPLVLVALPWEGGTPRIAFEDGAHTGTTVADGGGTDPVEGAVTWEDLDGDGVIDADELGEEWTEAPLDAAVPVDDGAGADPGDAPHDAGAAPPADNGGGAAATPAATPSAPAGSRAAEGPAPAPGGASPSPGASQPRPASGPHDQGASPTEVKVGFVILVSMQEHAQSLGGWAAPDHGDLRGQIRALVDHVNANGGIAGRKVIPVIREVDPQRSTAQAEEQLCVAFTEDDGVFAVVLQGMIRESTRHCYARRGVLTLDPSPFPMGGDVFRELAPHYWSPSYPSLSRTVRTLAPALKARDFFGTGAVTGVVMYDFPSYDKVLEEDLRPALRSAGVEIAHVAKINASDAGRLQAGLQSAILSLRGNGVNRVLFMGGAPLAPFFMITAEGQGFRPRYGLSTFDAPRALTGAVSPNQLAGAVGIGFAPAGDVNDAQFPFPSAELPAERRCLQVLAAGGHKLTTRGAARYGMAYCEALLLLQEGAKRDPSRLTVASWAGGAAQVGDAWQSAGTFRTRLADDQRDAAEAYRPFAYDPGCNCFGYTGGAERLAR